MRSPGIGDRLLPSARARLERGLGVDLGALRIHTGERAQFAARRLGARAFTVGRRVFLGENAAIHDDVLLAHEATHAVQQAYATTVQRLAVGPAAAGALEREAAVAGRTIAAGGTVRVSGRAVAGAPQHSDESPGFLERQILEFVDGRVPWLAPIIQRGPLNWLVDQVVAGLRSLVDSILQPVRSVVEVIGTVRAHVHVLAGWMVEIGGQLARGDCSGLVAAATKAQEFATGLASPVIERIREIAARVGNFFTQLWADYGAPAWDWLQRTAGSAWQAVQRVATQLWDATAPVRRMAGWAWNWLLRRVGIDSGGDSSAGLMGWVRRKLGEAWDRIRARLEPYKRQLIVVAGVLALLSPAGPIIVVGAAAAGLLVAARWISRVFAQPGGVVAERRAFRDEIVPTVRRWTTAITTAVSRGAAFVVEKLTAVVTGLRSAAGSLGDSLLSFLLTAANWLIERFQDLLAWALERLNGLADVVARGLTRLDAWLQPVLRVLERVGAVIENIFEVVALLAERAWNAIPACIRDPIVNFLVEHLLSRIPILREILQVPNVWARIRETAQTVIRRIFRGGLDVLGAALAIFRFLLEVLQVPVDLAMSVFRKAGAAIDVIVARPMQFLRNLLRGLAAGFQGFADNGLRYLGAGVVGWLVGQLPAGVRAPIPFSIGNVFRFVVDVLGITMERVWRIVQRVAPRAYAALRATAGALATAWDWLQTAMTEGVAGLWRRFTERISELAGTVRSAIAGFLFDQIVTRAAGRLATMLDPTGIMAVVNSIVFVYDMIRSAVEYAARMLAIVDGFLDSVLDLAAGSIAGAALRIERGLAAAVPVAIGFLANVLRISGLAAHMRASIERLQAWVERGIERLIHAAMRIGGAVVQAVGRLLTGRGLPQLTFQEDDGHAHVIAFPATGEEPTVASADPRPVMSFIETYQLAGRTDVGAARAAVTRIRAIVRALGAPTTPGDTRRLALQEEIVEHERILAAIIRPIFNARAALIATGRYDLEGMTGPHGEMQFPNDRMDADHQPHNLLIQRIAAMRAAVPAGRGGTPPLLFRGRRLIEIAAARASEAYTILLGRARHSQGRTYGGGSHSVADAGEVAARNAAARHPTDEDAQRRDVIGVLRSSMELDAGWTLGVVDRTPDDRCWSDIVGPAAQRTALIAEIRNQIAAGERQMRRQPLDGYGL